MQTAGPYHLVRPLSSSAVGDVFAGADDAGRPVTIAMLSPRAAADERWREAFAAATEAYGRVDVTRIAAADLRAERPWVACPEGAGPGAREIFEMLGQPMDAATEQIPAQRQPAEPITAEIMSLAQPVPMRSTVAPPPADETPLYIPPVEKPIRKPTGKPTEMPAEMPVGRPIGTPVEASAERPAADPIDEHTEQLPIIRPPRRTGLLIGAVAAACLLAGAAAGAGAMALTGDDDTVAVAAAPANPSPRDLLLPAEPPAAPGIEPPIGGGWPAGTPVFTPDEPTQPMVGLTGLGFDFRAPLGWTCTLQEQAAAAVRYLCGTGGGATADEIGGELTVRECAVPCTEDVRTQLRGQADAWGLKWIRSGPFAVFAETTQVDGQPKYGLVYMAFWRSVPEGVLDRQLVLRMTTPLESRDDLRKVANSIRDRTFTL